MGARLDNTPAAAEDVRYEPSFVGWTREMSALADIYNKLEWIAVHLHQWKKPLEFVEYPAPRQKPAVKTRLIDSIRNQLPMFRPTK